MKNVIIKKGILITLGILAVGGVGYFVYRTIDDRNKRIIKEGTFTIKVDETAPSTEIDNTDEPDLIESSTYGEYYGYDTGYDYGGYDPMWTSPYEANVYEYSYGDYIV